MLETTDTAEATQLKCQVGDKCLGDQCLDLAAVLGTRYQYEQNPGNIFEFLAATGNVRDT